MGGPYSARSDFGLRGPPSSLWLSAGFMPLPQRSFWEPPKRPILSAIFVVASATRFKHIVEA